LVGVVSGGGSSPTASVTGGLLFSNATSPDQLKGPFGFAGGSAGLGPVAGDNFSFGNDSRGSFIWENEIMGGVGANAPIPVPAEGHGGVSYTGTWWP
jgi:hypothetical protein